MKKRRTKNSPRTRRAAGSGARIRTVLGLLSIAGLAGFYYYFQEYLRESPRFQVRSVEVEGTRFLDEETVFEASGITGADNVFYFDPDTVKARVERLPYVKRCSVSVAFPDTVLLHIEERRPVASVFVHSRAYELDAEGVVLREFGPAEQPREPFITAVPGLAFVEPGDRLELAALREALEVWHACRETGIDNEVTVSELAAFAEDDIRMFCDDFRYEVRWGRGNYDRQALRLAAFWQEIGKYNPCEQYLDLRFGRDLACN